MSRRKMLRSKMNPHSLTHTGFTMSKLKRSESLVHFSSFYPTETFPNRGQLAYTQHSVAVDRCWFVDYTPYQCELRGGWGQCYKVMGFGTVKLPTQRQPVETPDCKNHAFVTVRNVLHVPDAPCNVLGRPCREQDIAMRYPDFLNGTRPESIWDDDGDGKGALEQIGYFHVVDPALDLLELKISEPPFGPQLGPRTITNPDIAKLVGSIWCLKMDDSCLIGDLMVDNERSRYSMWMEENGPFYPTFKIPPLDSREKDWLQQRYGDMFQFLKGLGRDPETHSGEFGKGRLAIREEMAAEVGIEEIGETNSQLEVASIKRSASEEVAAEMRIEASEERHGQFEVASIKRSASEEAEAQEQAIQLQMQQEAEEEERRIEEQRRLEVRRRMQEKRRVLEMEEKRMMGVKARMEEEQKLLEMEERKSEMEVAKRRRAKKKAEARRRNKKARKAKKSAATCLAPDGCPADGLGPIKAEAIAIKTEPITIKAGTIMIKTEA